MCMNLNVAAHGFFVVAIFVDYFVNLFSLF